ncbi:AI-2E family transporter [soil metagenome]|nr:AI-2E family transporter [Acidobacteriota bacterium]
MAADNDKPVLPSQKSEVIVEQPAEATDPIVIRMPVDVRGITLSVLAVLAGIVMLQYAESVLIPLVVAVLFGYVLGPAVDVLERRGLSRVIGSTIVLTLLCGLVGLGVYALSGQAMAIVERVPEAARRMAERFDSRAERPDGAIEKVQEAAKEVEEAAEQASDDPGERVRAERRGVQRVQIVEPTFAARNYLWAGGVGLMGLLGQIGMVLFLVFFILVTGDLFKRKLVKIAGPTLAKKRITVQIMDEVNRQISAFLRVQVITSVIVGVATAAALWWFGVEQYLVWGLLAGIFNSIPYLGPIIVSGGLAIVAFMQFDDIAMTLYVSGTALLITSLEGWLLTPALMSRASQMNAVAIFVGLLFWSWVWGVMGTILAVPMLMMVKAICDRIEDLQPIGELLGE